MAVLTGQFIPYVCIMCLEFVVTYLKNISVWARSRTVRQIKCFGLISNGAEHEQAKYIWGFRSVPKWSNIHKKISMSISSIYIKSVSYVVSEYKQLGKKWVSILDPCIQSTVIPAAVCVINVNQTKEKTIHCSWLNNFSSLNKNQFNSYSEDYVVGVCDIDKISRYFLGFYR